MMILKRILYKYTPICTADSILAIFNQNTVLFVFDFTLLLAHQLNEQQEIYTTSKFSKTLYSTSKLYQKSVRINKIFSDT